MYKCIIRYRQASSMTHPCPPNPPPPPSPLLNTFFPPYQFPLPAPASFHWPGDMKEQQWAQSRGGHRHLQIGRMLDIDLISEPPPTPPPHRCMHPKCGNLCGQRVRKRFIASWGLRMSHICPCTQCPSPKGIGQRSKVVILPTTGPEEK